MTGKLQLFVSHVQSLELYTTKGLDFTLDFNAIPETKQLLLN